MTKKTTERPETSLKDVQAQLTVWSKAQFYIGRPVRVWGRDEDGYPMDVTGLISEVVADRFTLQTVHGTSHLCDMSSFEGDPEFPDEHLHFLLMGPDINDSYAPEGEE